MRILLEREYWPTSTHGRISVNDRWVCHTLEAPKIPGCPKKSCLPEGSYLLGKEDQLPLLTLQKSPKGEFVGVVCAQKGLEVDMPQTIIPVQSILSEGRGTKPTMAFGRLLNALGIANKAGETLRLEIRSCPDKALNLAFCETAWMD